VRTWFDQDDVDRREVDCPHVVGERRSVTEASDCTLVERANLEVWLQDEDLPHSDRIDPRRRQPSRLGYAGGSNRSTILVVDDEADIRELLRELLRRSDYEVLEAADGKEALRMLYDASLDLVLLDVSMPALDGWATLERIREVSDVPVIMLTAQAEELQRVRGLKGGADDYVAKPFGRQELLARVEALLRRTKTREPTRERYQDAFVEIDYANRAVRIEGRDAQLTPLEFRLLTAFVENANQVLSREQLIALVWGDRRGVLSEQVKVYVGYVRRKLGIGDDGPIETVRGFGYRYNRP
jgi:DNA-binding response OmpR family regulator